MSTTLTVDVERRWSVRMRFWAAVIAVAIASTVLSGCMADPLPWPTVRDFLLAWQSERYRDAAAKTTGSTEQVASALEEAQQQLGARDLRLKVEHIEADDGTATATFLARMWLDGIGRQWTYEGHMQLRRRAGGNWEIIWSPTVIHPKLGKGEELAVVTELPSRAPVLGTEGKPLVRATPVVTLGVWPSALTNRRRALDVLATATGADRGRIRSRIATANPESFVPVVTLRRSTYTDIRGRITSLPGLRLHTGTLPLPPSPTFARALLGGVGPVAGQTPAADSAGRTGEAIRMSGLQLAFRQRLSGTPGSKVVALDDNGRQVAVLATFHGKQSRPVHTTIDSDVQQAAEEALNGLNRPAALVAMQSSTGRILGVANRPADSTYNRAFAGEYRPGSAFRPVATEALLRKGLDISAPVPCPSKRIVNGETFRNRPAISVYDTLSFRENFAISCETAFVGLSRMLEKGDLRRAGRTFGIGGDWTLPVPAFTGKVPSSSDSADRAEATIGEGGVRVSPLSMALMAGAVDSGTWHPPTLVTRPRQPSTTEAHPLPSGHARKLRELMRRTIEQGVAEELELPGRQVFGTAGTARTPDGGTHAWFTGFRGDIAFVVFVQGGRTGGDTAVPIAAEFLRSLDYAEVFESKTQTHASVG